MTSTTKRQDNRRPPARRQRDTPPTLRNWQEPPKRIVREEMPADVSVDCGWGQLIFAHTFDKQEDIVSELLKEAPEERHVAFYLRDPHVVLSLAPQDLFLDPSHTYRLWLDQYRPARHASKAFTIRRATNKRDEEGINRLLRTRNMVPLRQGYVEETLNDRTVSMLIATPAGVDPDDPANVVGFTMGVDHKRAFEDPENGSSLWSLVVDPQAHVPGVGEALVRRLAERFQGRGRAFMDLSVMHDNEQAIALYRKLGFRRAPVFALKRKSAINETLYVGPPEATGLNPYAQLIVDEAVRRGISIDILDAENGYFELRHGARSIVCRESLSELTTAVAMSRCDDKSVTRSILAEKGIRVPAQIKLTGDESDSPAVAEAGDAPDRIDEFLASHERVVVKPARGEQGAGISVDVSGREATDTAIGDARKHCDRVLLEEFVEGQDLRIIVIGDEVVAAAVRRPATIHGNGRDTIATLIEKTSRRRAAATGGESRIPLDEETDRCLAAAGYDHDDILPEGTDVQVRKTANLHTGGTIHDVTADLHPHLRDVAVAAASAIGIPVVGLDLLVPDPAGDHYVVIEANERPGLANHEPQPTAQKFIDLLFPQTVSRGTRQKDEKASK